MEAYINSSLAAGIICRSSSPAGAGFFFVEKKDKSQRLSIDYRGLNDITVKNSHLSYSRGRGSSAGWTYVTSTTWSTSVWEGDAWKAAFNTPAGHYEYLVMPFGLTKPPAVSRP